MIAKKIAAERAVSYAKDGMTVGLGTGSTALFAIEALGKMVRQGLSIKAVASSLASEAAAKKEGLIISAFSELTTIDLYIDGADEVDKSYNLIKGGGGALLREKILAYNSNRFIVIVDSTKLVDKLGCFPLPVEITPFAFELTMRHLKNLGCIALLRQHKGNNFVTDNENLIADCRFGEINDPAKLNYDINNLPGVVDNGLFINNMVEKVIVGYEIGRIDILENSFRSKGSAT